MLLMMLILTWMHREARGGFKATVGNRVTARLSLYHTQSFLFFSVSFKQSLVFLGLVSITRQMSRPRHKNKAIIRLSSHPSRQSLCFDSKLVVVVVVIGSMETRL